MTSIRKLISFGKETEFCSGTPVSGNWYAFPPGAYLSNTGARQAESIYTTGRKTRATTSYGYFSGQWNLSFIFDYNYLEPFEMMYELVTNDTKVTDTNDTFKTLDDAITIATSKHLHYFKKKNNSRVNSYTIRMKIMNVSAGGSSGSDETTILKGCVAKSINVSRSASGSQMSVEISGVYADQETTLNTSITDSDYHAYDTVALSQYSCMFVDGIDDEDYVADVDSHSWSSENNVSLVFNTCSPIASMYYEGNTNFSWNAQTYSNDPQKKFKLRPNSGGLNSTSLKPKGKGLAPMAKALFATYSASKRDTSSLTTIKSAITNSDNSVIFQMYDSTVKSMTWQKGDGSKMMDSLSSVECTNIIMRVVNKNSGIWISDHIVGTASATAHVFEYTAPTASGEAYSGQKIDVTYDPIQSLSLAGYEKYTVASAPEAATVLEGYLIVPYNTSDKCTSAHKLQNITPSDIILTNAAVTNTYTFTGDTGIVLQNVVDDDTVKVNILATAPTYKGTDLYFVVKPGAIPAEESGVQPNVPTASVGLLRVDVVNS